MGGIALSGRRVPLDEGKLVSHEALKKFEGTYARAMICGSIRRGKPEVGDVDIVMEVPPDGAAKMDLKLVELCGRQKNGKPNRKFLIDGVQVDIYLATAEDWGTQVLMWTGSKTFNITCRAKANSLGLMLNQYGLWDGETRLAGKTEEEAFKALDMKPVPPEGRD
jgi:DNA polymerase (family 10)